MHAGFVGFRNVTVAVACPAGEISPVAFGEHAQNMKWKRPFLAARFLQATKLSDKGQQLAHFSSPPPESLSATGETHKINGFPIAPE